VVFVLWLVQQAVFRNVFVASGDLVISLLWAWWLIDTRMSTSTGAKLS
jgi:hypothetical protein